MIVRIPCNTLTMMAGSFIIFLAQQSVFAQDNSVVAENQLTVITADTASQVQGATPAPTADIIQIPVQPINQVFTKLPEPLVVDQINCMQATIPMTYNKISGKFISNYLTRQRQFIGLMAERQQLYFPLYEELLQKHGLPDELKYLSIIESSLNPRAISKAKAAGLWQFMPSTGRYFKLYQDAYIDERMNPLKATEAACVYLKDLHRTFGDWHLALAAYNCGPGNVRRAIRRSGNKTSFWQIYNHLPAETRAYVPKFIAINYVMKYASAYNINTSSIARVIYSDTIVINQFLNMELLAKMINVPLEDLRMLNPQVKKNIVPAYLKNYVLNIPSEKKDTFTLNRLNILASMVKHSSANYNLASHQITHNVAGQTKVLYKVKSGDGLNKIALRYKVSVAEIQKWNRLKSTTIQSGAILVIWLPGPKNILADNKVNPVSPEPVSMVKPVLISQIKVYFVQPGDTLLKISQLHGGVAVERIIKHNRLNTKEIKPGQKLIIS